VKVFLKAKRKSMMKRIPVMIARDPRAMPIVSEKNKVAVDVI